MDHEAGTAPSAVAQAAPGDVAESQSRQGIVTGTTQDCTDRLRAMLLGSELLHGPGSAQGPWLMATSCRTLVGLRYPRQPGLWALGLSGKGCRAVWILPGAGRELYFKAEAGENASLAWHRVLGPWVGSSGLSLTQDPQGVPAVAFPRCCSIGSGHTGVCAELEPRALCLPFRASLGGCLCLDWKNGVVSL